jgi:hypothetical protein
MRRKLEHTVIYRGGQISGNHFEVTRECHASVEKGGIFVRNSLTFEFEIPSGGGFSTITLEVGEKDLPAILKEIARTMPELAIVFSECTTVALRVEAGNATKRSMKNEVRG